MSMKAILERQTLLLEAFVKSAGGKVPGSSAPRSIYNQPRKQRNLSQKATLQLNDPPTGQALIDDSRPLYDSDTRLGGFFQDMSLKKGLFNLLINPSRGIAADIPVSPENVLEKKYGYLVRYQFDDVAGATAGGGCCESCSEVEGDYDFAKIRFPYGKLCRSASTICITELILKAKTFQFDDFYIIGEYRGTSATIKFNTFKSRDAVVASAVQRKMAFLGSYFQQWIDRRVWTADVTTPSNNQEKEFYGLLRLISASYHTPGAFPIEVSSGNYNEATALNSIVMNANDYSTTGDAVIGDGDFSIYSILLQAEEQLYMRASGTNMLPVQWKIWMHSSVWKELTEHMACEMASYGCVVPGGDCVDKTISLTTSDGGMALMTMTIRQQMRESMTINLNGRTYAVKIDDNMPYAKPAGATAMENKYKSSIFFIPYTVAGGERALWWEHIDYSEIDDKLSPIPGTRYNAHGWTDGGRYLHTVHQINKCMKVTVEMQMRLIFIAPHLALRIDNVGASMNYALPLYWKEDGSKSGLLVQ